jgi:hypothetical protein
LEVTSKITLDILLASIGHGSKKFDGFNRHYMEGETRMQDLEPLGTTDLWNLDTGSVIYLE